DMTTTLRLQLTFIRYDANGFPDARYTLTLPPIRMEMPRDARPGDPVAKTFQVAHRGQSSLFVEPRPANVFEDVAACRKDGPCPVAVPITCQWEVRRDGT